MLVMIELMTIISLFESCSFEAFRAIAQTLTLTHEVQVAFNAVICALTMQFTFQVIRVVVVGVLLFIAIKYAIANSIPFLNFHFILLHLEQFT